ncbi:MAG TPA: transglutaminase domain-containing protein [Flavitalea sp.]|nr:transglutaminase domain-containing protein [Flavitalea sp.]
MTPCTIKNVAIVYLLVVLTGCSHKVFIQEKVDNPIFHNNSSFDSSENISLTKFVSLKEKYKTDTIFKGEPDEFKRILLLRNWIRKVIPNNDYLDSYPGDGYAEAILDAGLRGQGFHCGHYMVVQNAIMNAYGYVTRCVGSGPGIKGGPDGHHGMNEIWLNKYHKWFLSDAQYNHHFEKNGIPLSALEVRDEHLKNKGADVQLVKGTDRIPLAADLIANKNGIYIKRTKEEFLQWYTWLEWDHTNNRYSAWPHFTSRINMYRDDYFKNHIWIWDGKPHWAYNTDVINFVDSRHAIEWTPNTILGSVVIDGQSATISLKSNTPNFREYQMKNISEGTWAKCDSVVTLPLDKDRVELAFHSVNAANVTGPEYKIVLNIQP